MTRRSPGSVAVHASVARTTTSHLMVPPLVTTAGRRRSPRFSTAVCSKSRTPCRSTASAKPRARRAGWSAAQCGVKVAPKTFVAPISSLASLGPSHRTSSTPSPSARDWSIAASARSRCASFLARDTEPPLAKWHSIPSATALVPTTSTLSCMAVRMARMAATPCRRAKATSEAGNSEEHQPPLRPDAPKPATSRSTTATRSVGSADARERAVQSPVKPAPTMQTSTSRSSLSAGRAGNGAGMALHHKESR